MKYITLVIFLISSNIQSQDCYKIVDSMNGVDYSSYLSTLESNACELRNALPNQFEEDFKVYSFDFYSISKYYRSGYPEIFEDILSQVRSESTYYLLIGNASDKSNLYAETYVKINIPLADSLSCLKSEQFGPIENEIRKVIKSGNNKGIGGYMQSTIDGMQLLSDFLENKKECCMNKSINSCNECMEEEDLVGYLLDSGYDICQEYSLNPLEFEDTSSNFKQYTQLSIESDGNTINLNNEIKVFLNELSTVIPNVEGEIRYNENGADCLQILNLSTKEKFKNINEPYYSIKIIRTGNSVVGYSLAIKVESNLKDLNGEGKNTLYFLNSDANVNITGVMEQTEYFLNELGIGSKIKMKKVNSAENLKIGQTDAVVIFGSTRTQILDIAFGNANICDNLSTESYEKIDSWETLAGYSPEVSAVPVITMSTEDLGIFYTDWNSPTNNNQLDNNPNRLMGFIILHGLGHLAGFCHGDETLCIKNSEESLRGKEFAASARLIRTRIQGGNWDFEKLVKEGLIERPHIDDYILAVFGL